MKRFIASFIAVFICLPSAIIVAVVSDKNYKMQAVLLLGIGVYIVSAYRDIPLV